MLEIAVSHTTSLTLPRVRSFFVAVISIKTRMPPISSETSHSPEGSPAAAGAHENMPAKVSRKSRQRRNLSSDRTRQWSFALVSGCVDISAWIILTQTISKSTGSYNMVTPEVLFIPVVVLMLCIALVGAYRFKRDFASLQYASEHCIACIAAYPLSAFLLYVVTSFGSSIGTSRLIFSVSLILFCIISLQLRRIYWFYQQKHYSNSKLIVLADAELGPLFYSEYLASGLNQKIRFFAVEPSLCGNPIGGEGTPIIESDVSELEEFLKKTDVMECEAIILAARFSHVSHQIMRDLGVMHFDERPVYSIESFYEKYWSRVCLKLVNPGWPLQTNFSLVENTAYSIGKRFVDVLFSILALLILSPILLLVIIAIYLIDGSPVIYSQERTGIHQIPFKLFKFRTMRHGSDLGDRYTRENDARVTPLGLFLRKTRLDELPQLWNVLLGDMSIIGPRPEWVKLVEDYEVMVPNYHFRHLVRPGITGWAQVNYPYGASLEDTLQKLSYDLYYIRNFSLRLDAEVLLKTLHVVSFGKGR